MLLGKMVRDGRQTLVLGLDETNIERLKNDQPILKGLGPVEGLEEWDVTILGPEDTVRFIAHVEAKKRTGGT
jgi:hypothetical protein